MNSGWRKSGSYTQCHAGQELPFKNKWRYAVCRTIDKTEDNLTRKIKSVSGKCHIFFSFGGCRFYVDT